ncbi:MAG: hypothetical protein D6B25_06310 [Desulfobulbaceae bacterium]|nr:MAG: hypothetical protein D6B25_06310 [Desulfobulbaceae bacterium]
MKKIAKMVCILVVSLVPTLGHGAFQAIGIIKSVEGEVYLISSSTEIQAVSNMKLISGDNIITGNDGSVGLIFKDDTVVSLGPNSQIEVQDFVFNPAEEKLSFAARLVRGTFSFITGQIAKLAPKKVKLTTPDATLGVRGTKFVVEVK